MPAYGGGHWYALALREARTENHVNNSRILPVSGWRLIYVESLTATTWAEIRLPSMTPNLARGLSHNPARLPKVSGDSAGTMSANRILVA